MTLMYQPIVGRVACCPAPPETASAIASTSRRPSSSYVTTMSGFVVPVSIATAWWRSATRPSTSEGRKMDIAKAMLGRASTREMPARTSCSVARRRSPVRPSTMFGQSEPGPNQAVSPPHAIAGRPDRSCRVSDFGAKASASATSRGGMRTRSASSTCAPATASRRRASGWSTRTPVRSRIVQAADWIRAQPSSDRRFQRPAPGVIAAGPDRSLGRAGEPSSMGPPSAGACRAARWVRQCGMARSCGALQHAAGPAVPGAPRPGRDGPGRPGAGSCEHPGATSAPARRLACNAGGRDARPLPWPPGSRRPRARPTGVNGSERGGPCAHPVHRARAIVATLAASLALATVSCGGRVRNGTRRGRSRPATCMEHESRASTDRMTRLSPVGSERDALRSGARRTRVDLLEVKAD